MNPGNARAPAFGAAPAAIIVEGRLAALQWEIHLAAPLLEARAAAWPSAPILTYRAWLERLWLADARPGSPALLGPSQSAALWREVIAESAEGPALLGTPGVAAWAESAHRSLAAACISAQASASGRSEDDYAAFLRWRKRYLERLDEAGWIDAAGVEAALAERAPRRAAPIEIAASFEPTPAARRLLETLAAAGSRVATRTFPEVRSRAARVRLEDSREEIAAAVRWALRRLERSPDARIAIVVPGLRAAAAEIRRIVAAEGASYVACFAYEPPTDTRPVIGAALNALRLLSARGTFVELGRWLRSPFFADAEPAALARAGRFEAELRGKLLAQLPFLAAYRRAGLRTRMAARLAAHAERLDRALEEIGADVPRAPSHWARRWQRALNALGWASGAPADGSDLRAWDAALDELARLTPIVGRVTYARALAELEALLSRAPRPACLPVSGIHVLEDLSEIGPGYDAAWMTGVTDRALPRPVSLNPLLPRSLQAEHLPWATPEDALARSRRLLEGCLRRVPDVVLSWPAAEHENPAEPSPLIRALPIRAADELPDRPMLRRRARETVRDEAPPAPEGRLRGGTRALDAAARCPLRAFLEFRLGARPLEPWTRGVPARLRGIAIHRALELLYRRRGSQSELAALTEAERREEAHACIETALDEVFGAARRPLGALWALERGSIEASVDAFLEREIERAPFAVAALERAQTVELGPWRVTTRVDRIDELEDGTLAILDYKTGRGPSQAEWFSARPRDLQLPLYAVASSRPVSALVVASVGIEKAGYAGIWQDPRGFPGRLVRLPPGRALAEQIDAWRESMTRLLNEHASGDTRVFVHDLEPAEGAFAPLTRVYEQLALHEGWLARWPDA